MAFFAQRFFALLIVVIIGSTATLSSANEPVFLPVHPEPLEIISSDEEIIATFDVEIAVTPDQRATGLMHRKDFGGNSAMLFEFETPRRIAMWMKNTPSSLDMIFAGSDGKIHAIVRSTTPFSLAVISPAVVSKYVVEIGSREVEKRGIKIGQFLRHVKVEGNLQ